MIHPGCHEQAPNRLLAGVFSCGMGELLRNCGSRAVEGVFLCCY